MVALISICLVITGLIGLDYLVNEERKQDPVTKNVSLENKDTYNNYGLTLGTELSTHPFYEDENYIYYPDRILKKIQYNEKNIEDAAVIIEKMRGIIPESVHKFFMPIPERVLIEDGYQEQKELYNQYLEKIKPAFKESMEFLNVLPTLEEHKNEYVFFRTENGWTTRGAYYGASLLCETMGVTSISLDGYEENVYNTFRGTMKQEIRDSHPEDSEIYTKVGEIQDDPLFIHLLPESKNRAVRTRIENGNKVTDVINTVSKSRTGKAVFCGSDYQWLLADGDAKNQDKKEGTALLLCDGSGGMMIPYLTSYYKQVCVVNISYNQFETEDLKQIFEVYDVSDMFWVQRAETFGDISQSVLLKNIYDITE